MVEIFDAGRESGADPDSWPASRLTQPHRDFLSKFEQTVEVLIDGLGPVLCCHAGPDSDELPIITPATPDQVIAVALASTKARVVVARHTHIQFYRQAPARRIATTGS